LAPKKTRRSTRSSFPPAELLGPLLAGAATFVGAWAFVAFTPALHTWLSGADVAYYENWGSWLAQHRVPYRDFAFDYPPGALPVIDAPWYLRKLFAYHGGYDFWFRVLLLLVGLASLVAMAWVLVRLGASRHRAYAALVVAGLVPALLGPIALSRYDYWPAMLAVVGVAALVSGRPTFACAVFAAGVVVKVYPVIFLPFALVELWRRGRWRAVAGGFAAAVAVLAAGFAPFLALAPHGLWWSVARQISRPLQVESLGSAVLVAAHALAGVQLHHQAAIGSDNFVGHWASVLGTASGVVTALALLAVYAGYVFGRSSPERIVIACAAAMVAYIAFTKVLSPQYLVWLAPLVPLVGGRAGLRANAIFVVLLAMTQVWEPYRYHQYYVVLDPWLVWLVVARDLLLVVLFVVLLWPLLPSQRHAQELDPVGAALV